MREIPECLSRRYQALDDLVKDLTAAMTDNSDAEQPKDPSLKLMCDFWNILKEDPDCNLKNEVQRRMCDVKSSSYYHVPPVTCYMACCDSKKDEGKEDKGGTDRKDWKELKVKSCPPKNQQQCCGSKPETYIDDSFPLSKVLCNLKEAATYERKCNVRLNELLETEKDLKTQIQNLEQREKEGMAMMMQADCMWTCMETAYKKKVSESIERQKELMKQMKEVEKSTTKWRRNKKELESQLCMVRRCHEEIKQKIVQKTNDISCMNKEIEDYKKRIETTRKDTDSTRKFLSNKKQTSESKMATISEQIKKLEKELAEQTRNKYLKELQGNKSIKEAREELQNMCKVLLQKRLENEDLKAEKDALIQEIDMLKETSDQCKDKCTSKEKFIEQEIRKVEKEIADFQLKCVQCHKCVDTSDVRRFCTDCPKCAEERDCIYEEDNCTPDPANDCICQSIKQKFLDNVFDNMYSVLEKQAQTDPGKAVADAILRSLKNSRNGKLSDSAKKILQEFILSTVKQNLNLTIVGGAVKTRCEMDTESYQQLMNCLKQIKAVKPPKVDKATTKKDACRRWASSNECNCPMGPKDCICTKKAPPAPKDPTPCPPPDEEDVGVKAACPMKEDTICGIDCGARSPNDKDWHPDPCKGPTCHFPKNMRAAQCVLGPDPLISTSSFKKQTIPEFSVLEDQIYCKCGSSPSKPCTCKRDRASQPRQRMIEEVLGRYIDVTPIQKVGNMNQIETSESKKGIETYDGAIMNTNRAPKRVISQHTENNLLKSVTFEGILSSENIKNKSFCRNKTDKSTEGADYSTYSEPFKLSATKIVRLISRQNKKKSSDDIPQMLTIGNIPKSQYQMNVDNEMNYPIIAPSRVSSKGSVEKTLKDTSSLRADVNEPSEQNASFKTLKSFVETQNEELNSFVISSHDKKEWNDKENSGKVFGLLKDMIISKSNIFTMSPDIEIITVESFLKKITEHTKRSKSNETLNEIEVSSNILGRIKDNEIIHMRRKSHTKHDNFLSNMSLTSSLVNSLSDNIKSEISNEPAEMSENELNKLYDVYEQLQHINQRMNDKCKTQKDNWDDVGAKVNDIIKSDAGKDKKQVKAENKIDKDCNSDNCSISQYECTTKSYSKDKKPLKSQLKMMIPNSGGGNMFDNVTELMYTPSGALAMELDETVIEKLTNKAKETDLYVSLKETNSGNYLLLFDTPASTKKENKRALLKSTPSGVLTFEIDRQMLDTLNKTASSSGHGSGQDTDTSSVSVEVLKRKKRTKRVDIDFGPSLNPELPNVTPLKMKQLPDENLIEILSRTPSTKITKKDRGRRERQIAPKKSEFKSDNMLLPILEKVDNSCDCDTVQTIHINNNMVNDSPTMMVRPNSLAHKSVSPLAQPILPHRSSFISERLSNYMLQHGKKSIIDYTEELKNIYCINGDVINFKIEGANGVRAKLHTVITITQSGHMALYVNNIAGVGELSSMDTERPVLLNRSNSGTYTCYLGLRDKAPNTVLRKTPSGGYLVVITEPVLKSMPVSTSSRDEYSDFATILDIFKVKVAGSVDLEYSPALLKYTASENYDLVFDKEFENHQKSVITSCLGDDLQNYIWLEQTPSKSILIYFKEPKEKRNSQQIGLLTKSESGKIRVLVNGPVFDAITDRLLLPESILKTEKNPFEQFLKNMAPSTSRNKKLPEVKSKSDSNLYQKSISVLHDDQSILSTSMATLKVTNSGQYAVVLNKDSKKAFIDDLRNYLGSSRGVIPIWKGSETGDITIVLSGNKKSINQCGSLKITPSGNIYIIVNKRDLASICKDIETSGPSDSILKSILNKQVSSSTLLCNKLKGKSIKYDNKSVATTCNVKPDDCCCDTSKCICGVTQCKTKESGGKQYAVFSITSVDNPKVMKPLWHYEEHKKHNNDYDFEEVSKKSSQDISLCERSSKGIPHIVIKPCSCSDNHDFSKDKCFYTLEPTFYNKEFRVNSSNFKESGRYKKSLINSSSGSYGQFDICNVSQKESWDSLVYLPPQLPSFLREYSFTYLK